MIDALDKLAPEKANYRHNAEGADDMVRIHAYSVDLACTYKVGAHGDEY